MARLSKKNEELLRAVQRQSARQQVARQSASKLKASQTVQQAGTSKDALQTGTSQAAEQHDANQNTQQLNASQNAQQIDVNQYAEQQGTQSGSMQGQQNRSLERNNSAVGLGVDLVEIERMEKAIARTPRILERVFTSNEREYAWSKTRPATHYAAFFAAREAVTKALGTGFAGINYSDVEIVHDDRGKPEVLLHGNAQAIADEQGVVEIQISLSHTHQMAVASAVAIKALSSPPKHEVLDPMEELTRQFKELRSLLDDIGISEPDATEKAKESSEEPKAEEEAEAVLEAESAEDDAEAEDPSLCTEQEATETPVEHKTTPSEEADEEQEDR